MSLPRYPKYKESEDPWLGAVPSDWPIQSGRRVFAPTRIPALPNDEQLSATQKYGVIPQSVFIGREEQKVVLALKGTDSFKHVEADDFVISLRSFQGGIERCLYSGCVSPAYTVLKSSRSIDPAYWGYLFKSAPYISALVSTTCSIREGKAIGFEQFGAIAVPVPSLCEQNSIAIFLDQETGKIDALITQMQSLIELLKEKRQAVISHAVTKGLTPDAPMKDSGIEWLGKIPSHWKLGSIKFWFETSSGGTPDTQRQQEFYTDEGGYPWIRTTDLNNDVLRSYEISITDKAIANSACKMLPAGSVLIAMYGGDGTIGKNSLLAIDACINQAICALLPTSQFSSAFAFRFAQFYRPYWMVGAEGSRKDPNINQGLIRNTPILCPPLGEQVAIADFIQKEVTHLDLLEFEATHAIDLLQERRSVLICAAVTGKIDVRNLTTTEAA